MQVEDVQQVDIPLVTLAFYGTTEDELGFNNWHTFWLRNKRFLVIQKEIHLSKEAC